MRHHIIYLFLSLALLLLLIDPTLEYQSSIENSRYHLSKATSVLRAKRQLEDLEQDEYPTPSAQEAQESPGFWDKVVKVALRLFNKFIEWLNSS